MAKKDTDATWFGAAIAFDRAKQSESYVEPDAMNTL
jgi:hypothetical protein